MPVLTFWKTAQVTTATLVAFSTSIPYQFLFIQDDLAGQIGLGYQKGSPTVTDGVSPAAGWSWQSPFTQGFNPDLNAVKVFGTYEQAGFTLAANSNVSSVGLWQACQASSSCSGSVCSTLYYTLGLNFTLYDATSVGAPSAGATFAGTYLAFTNFLSSFAGIGNTSFQIRALLLSFLSPCPYNTVSVKRGGWKSPK